MKKVISLAMVLLMLVSLCSCKQKSDEELASLNKESSVSGTYKTNETKPETEENVDTLPATDITENEPDTKTQFENTTGVISSENTEANNAETESAEQSFNNYERVCDYHYIEATYNDITYNKVIHRKYFEEGSVYHGIDFGTFETTDETVEIGYFCPLETDGYGCHLRKTAVICKLPDIMENDEMIDFLVVRFEDGEYDMLFDIDPPKDSTLYELHCALQRLYGENFSSPEYIEEIRFSYGENGDSYVVTDRSDITEIYNTLISATCTAQYDPVIHRNENFYRIMLYNDNLYNYEDIGGPSYGSHAHWLVYSDSYIRVLPYPDYYLNDDGFEELLQSFMTEENLVKE